MKLKKVSLLLISCLIILAAAINNKVEALEWAGTGAVSVKFQKFISGIGTAKDAGLQDSDIDLEHLHLKLSVDISDTAAVIIGPCLAHHALFSVRFAYLEAEIIELDMETILGLEAGRFIVPFGRFNTLAEVTTYPTISRPMMFASHEQDIIIPHGYPHPIFMSEYSDIGINLNGNKWFADAVQLNYFVWVGNGLFNLGYEGHAHGGHNDDMASPETDISWLMEKRFISDNNNSKAFGGKLAVSFKENVTVSGSYMAGKYDPAAKLDYAAFGGEVSLRFWKIQINSEYIISPTEFTAYDSTSSTNGMIAKNDKYTTTGYYAQLIFSFAEKWELVGMYDVLQRKGLEFEEKMIGGEEYNVIDITGKDKTTSINKISVGINFSPIELLKIKTEYSFYKFEEKAHGGGGGGHGHDEIQRVNLAFVVSF